MKRLLAAAALALLPVASAQSYRVTATAYNAHASQTDSTPNITATGTRVRPGIVALSRDMLRVFPYGSRVRITSSRGCGINLNGQVFRVEDTMHRRKVRQIDIFMRSHSRAIAFGRCSVTIRRA